MSSYVFVLQKQHKQPQDCTYSYKYDLQPSCLSSSAEQTVDAQKEVKRLNQLLQALEMASAGDARGMLGLDDEDADISMMSSGAVAGGTTRATGKGISSRVNLAEIKQQLQRQLKMQVCCGCHCLSASEPPCMLH